LYLEKVLKHLEHVSKRITAGITSKRADFWLFSAFLGTIVETIGNLIIPFDRAHRVVLGTRLERLKHVPMRITAEITIISRTFLSRGKNLIRNHSNGWEWIGMDGNGGECPNSFFLLGFY